VFAGPVSDSSYYKDIVSEIKRNDLESIVKVLGTVSLQHLKDIYHEADLFVILSNNEAGLPQTCLEAMSSGLPLIVSNKQFFHQSLSSDFAAFVNSESTDDVSEAIVSLLIDEKRRKKMGHFARLYAMKFYSFDSYIHHLVSVYQATIEEQSVSRTKGC
jgi:glycosyltransferase involved in cell wall biosynthesis